MGSDAAAPLDPTQAGGDDDAGAPLDAGGEVEGPAAPPAAGSGGGSDAAVPTGPGPAAGGAGAMPIRNPFFDLVRILSAAVFTVESIAELTLVLGYLVVDNELAVAVLTVLHEAGACDGTSESLCEPVCQAVIEQDPDCWQDIICSEQLRTVCGRN